MFQGSQHRTHVILVGIVTIRRLKTRTDIFPRLHHGRVGGILFDRIDLCDQDRERSVYGTGSSDP
jgi:hypothetical protein